MATLRELRTRVASIKNIQRVTNAMQMVAAAKMRRAQERALAARPYAERMRHVLADLANAGGSDDADGGALHALLERRRGARHTTRGTASH